MTLSAVKAATNKHQMFVNREKPSKDSTMNPVAYLPQSQRLLDLVREVLRYRHYSLKTEQAYLHWVRFFVRWHGRGAGDAILEHARQ